MDAKNFLLALGSQFKIAEEDFQSVNRSGEWTAFMLRCLLRMAKKSDLHVCARGIHALPEMGAQHTSKEYLFDLTLYERDNWKAWSLPSVIIEHENGWAQDIFMQDFWKLLIGYAPLRVMFGYARDQSAENALVEHVLKEARDCRWSYPSGVADLVLIRYPAQSWPTWRVIHRAVSSSVWVDESWKRLDGFTLPIP